MIIQFDHSCQTSRRTGKNFADQINFWIKNISNCLVIDQQSMQQQKIKQIYIGYN